MSTINPEVWQAVWQGLTAPFLVSEHDFHPYHKFVYLKEPALRGRLNVWLPGHSLHITDKNVTYPTNIVNVTETTPIGATTQVKQWTQILSDDVPYVTVWGYLEWNGIVQANVGGDIQTNLGKENGTQMMNTEKAAATDLLKRCAMSWGVGLYLKEITKDDNINNLESLRVWLHRQYPDDPVYLSEWEKAKAKFTENVIAAKPSAYSTQEDVATAIKDRRIKISGIESLRRAYEFLVA